MNAWLIEKRQENVSRNKNDRRRDKLHTLYTTFDGERFGGGYLVELSEAHSPKTQGNFQLCTWYKYEQQQGLIAVFSRCSEQDGLTAIQPHVRVGGNLSNVPATFAGPRNSDHTRKRCHQPSINRVSVQQNTYHHAAPLSQGTLHF